MDLRDIAVVFTGTVRPNISNPGVVIDPSRRLREYLEAVGPNSRTVAPLVRRERVVFAESSGWDINAFSGISDFCTLYQPKIAVRPLDAARGKGFAELQIIKAVFSEYPAIKGVLKVTGRLRVLNLDKIFSDLADAPNDATVIADVCNRFTYVDCRCLYLSREAVVRLAQDQDILDDNAGVWLEKLLAMHFKDDVCRGRRASISKRLPVILGVSGANGVSYSHRSAREHVRHFLMRHIGMWLLQRGVIR